MGDWQLTIDTADLVRRWDGNGGDLDIPALAILVVARFKESEWRLVTADPEAFDRAIAAVQSATDQAGYVAAFELVYDRADADRVWIDTH